MKKRVVLAAFIAAVLGAQKAQAIFTVSQERCAADSLEQSQAPLRMAWIMKCDPKTRAILEALSEGRKGDPSYFEVSGRAGYLMYVRYNEDGGIAEIVRAPLVANPTEADCLVADPANPSQKIPFASIYRPAYACASGCYTGDQQVLFAGGYLPIGSAEASLQTQVVTLTEDATFDRLKYQSSPLAHIVQDKKDQKQTILTFVMKSGNTLKVTENHPLVTTKGTVARADQFKRGDELINDLGERDPIRSIEKSEFFGKVYNVDVRAEAKLNQVVLAQGYLNGSVYWQNEGVSELNREILRHGGVITNAMVQ